MKNQEERVFIGRYENTFIFKAEGRLTQKSLWNVNTAIQKCMEDTAITDVLIDITHCFYMDSTILGIIARWAISFGKTHLSQPFLIGLEESPLKSIFRRMNLTTLFCVSENVGVVEKSTPSQLSFSDQYSAKEYGEHLLSAHETLAELSSDNAKEFAAVIQCLKADLKPE
jgi:anti-anti-sigma regulatory factor